MVKNKAMLIVLMLSFLFGTQPIMAISAYGNTNRADVAENDIGSRLTGISEALKQASTGVAETGNAATRDAATSNASSNNTQGSAFEAFPLEAAEPNAIYQNGTNTSENISNGLVAKKIMINQIDEVNNIKVNGGLPQVEGLNQTSFASFLNDKIRQSYTNLVNAGYRNINTEYDVYNWANITSIVVRYNIGGANSLNKKQVVRTFVFDDISQSEVTLRNLLGKDYMNYLNKYISGEINRNSAGIYYAGANKFSSIKSNQSFYIKGGVIHILFDEHTIAPASAGTPEFQIPMESITFTLSRREYAGESGEIYIPITVAMRLGMKVELKAGGVMEITSHDGKKITVINVNNDKVNHSDVILINGYDIALAEEYFKRELGISIERKENSKEIEISYIF